MCTLHASFGCWSACDSLTSHVPRQGSSVPRLGRNSCLITRMPISGPKPDTRYDWSVGGEHQSFWQNKQMLEWFNGVEPCDGRHDKSCSGWGVVIWRWGVVISQWGDGFRATLFGERFLIGKRMRQEAGNENQTVFD